LKDPAENRFINYGGIELDLLETDVPKLTGKAMAVFSADEIAEVIRAIISETKIKTKLCAFSIPDFSTFFTNFTFAADEQKRTAGSGGIRGAAAYTASDGKVTVDWQLVGGSADMSQKIEVTVAAIPNEIIARYKEIATKAKLEISLLEAEMFGLTQALVPPTETRPVCLVDIGAQSTVCSLIENRVLRYSHSFDRGSAYLADGLIDRLPLDPEAAANLKQDYGLRFIPYMDPEIRGAIKKY